MMSIAALAGTYKARGRALLERIPRDALLLGVALLASLASFGLGYLEGRDSAIGQGGAISIELAPSAEAELALDPRESRDDEDATVAGAPTDATPAAGQGSGVYVASKNGTKYYLPTCSGAKRIKEENKVWFNTIAAAVAEGYTPAANCPGLK